MMINGKPTGLDAEESAGNFWQKLCCPKCPEEGDTGRISPGMLANQVYYVVPINYVEITEIF